MDEYKVPFNVNEKNRMSILNGDQLKHIKTLIGDFSKDTKDFQRLKSEVAIGYGYILSLPEIRQSMIILVGKYNDRITDPTMHLSIEDIEPRSWTNGDKLLNKKMNLFVNLLSDSISACQQKRQIIGNS